MALERKFYQIRDALMKVRVSLLEGTANEFDFYRYLPKRENELSTNVKNQIKKKFQTVFKLFLHRVRTNSSKEVETLNEIQDLLTLRKFKQYELNDFKIDADITCDDQDLIKNTLIPIADIIKTRTENFQSFQRSNPKLFIDYYKKRAIKSGSFMSQNNGTSQEINRLRESISRPNENLGDGRRSSRAVANAKMKLAETHEIPEDWESNIEKVFNFL
jgi:LPS O-antigen subunit length determinant protein (WzzB/FepE family)